MLADLGGEPLDADAAGDDAQLLDGRRAIDVRGHHDDVLLLALLQPQRELAGAGGLARALQAGHQDDGGRLLAQVEGLGVAAQGLGQLLLHHLEELLARGQRLQDLGAEGAGLDLVDEVLDHRQGDVGLQQRHAQLAGGGIDLVFGEAALAANGLEDAGKARRKVIEHGERLAGFGGFGPILVQDLPQCPKPFAYSLLPTPYTVIRSPRCRWW